MLQQPPSSSEQSVGSLPSRKSQRVTLESSDLNTAQPKSIFRLTSHPASLLDDPRVKRLSDDLENPSYNRSDVLQVIGSQGLESKISQVNCVCLFMLKIKPLRLNLEQIQTKAIVFLFCFS